MAIYICCCSLLTLKKPDVEQNLPTFVIICYTISHDTVLWVIPHCKRSLQAQVIVHCLSYSHQVEISESGGSQHEAIGNGAAAIDGKRGD
jgi:hypothetical protein